MTSGRRSRQEKAAGLRISSLPPVDADGYHVVHEFKFQANRESLRRIGRSERHTFRSLRKPGVGVSNGFRQRTGWAPPRGQADETIGHSTQQHVWRKRAVNRTHRKMRRVTRQAMW